MQRFAPFALTLSLLSTSGCWLFTPEGGEGNDEAGGFEEEPDGKANIYKLHLDPRVRMYGKPGKPLGDFAVDIYGSIIDILPEQPEWTPYLVSTPPLPEYPLQRPPRPSPRGLTNLDLDTAVAEGKLDGINELRGYGATVGSPQIVDPNMPPKHLTDQRSWLVGNFGVYLGVDQVPAKHPRAPGMANLLIKTLEILDFGRVNLAGAPCNAVSWSGGNGDPLGGVKPGDPTSMTKQDEDCRSFLRAGKLKPIAPQWALMETAMTNSIAAATCLHNGGADGIIEAIPNALDRNNGLVYLNLANYEDLVVELIELIPQGGEAVTETYETILEVLQTFEYLGIDLTPADLTYPYFTWSGVCGFKAELRPSTIQGGTVPQLMTAANCPWKHYPVLPSFNEEQVFQSVEGYCALPLHYPAPEVEGGDPANEAAATPAVIPPEQSAHDVPKGIRMYTITPAAADSIASWARSVQRVETDDGIVLRASTQEGIDALALFGLEDGDIVVSVDSDIDLRGSAAVRSTVEKLIAEDALCDDDMEPTECSDLKDAARSWSASDLAFWRINAALGRYDHVTLWVKRGSTWLPTYLRR